ncbi:MAG: haloacid dehalogenase [Chloroflexi bacterium]|nr:haloacid dehalogenase [Chloroflexota bacterium]
MLLPLETLAERALREFEARNAAREQALTHARKLVRASARAIQAVHREDYKAAQNFLDEGRTIAQRLHTDLADYPDLFYAGYTQDALKEYAEANIVYSLIAGHPLPMPEDLQVPTNTYLRGLAEAVGELRRHTLNILRHGYSQRAETMLAYMDEIYGLLILMDYPDAITGGLRRLTDVARSLIERTRGDITLSLRLQEVETLLREWHQHQHKGA